MSNGPDFEELVGGDLPPEEAARLKRIHELLLEAGPPPELPPNLAEPPSERKEKSVSYLPRRRLGTVLALAAALAAAAFGGGYLLAGHGSRFSAELTIPMHGTAIPSAQASLALASPDSAGNREIQMVVRGLPDLGRKGYYELFLTRHGKVAASCGTFVVHERAATTVRLNAPYVLPEASQPGWIIVSHLRGTRATPTLLTT